ncbi:MAG: hypothetical protein JSU92_04630 [Deltaproteobacteria bacterium]|nr:MAG: hypothetical protein JSU92_04630 [Deltaproteobacteria bacterium]
MKQRKGTVWALVISATVITAGLILNCSDDAATCKTACEKSSEYRIFDEFKNGPQNVEECVKMCEEELVDHEVETKRAINCIIDKTSREEIIDCLLKR